MAEKKPKRKQLKPKSRVKVDLPFESLTKREQKKVRIAAYKQWARCRLREKEYPNSLLANEFGMTMDELEYWKAKDQWEERFELQLEKDAELSKTRLARGKRHIKTPEGAEKDINEIYHILESADLTEREKLFVMYYLQSYDEKLAAHKAGYAESSVMERIGSSLLRRPKIADTIKQIKIIMQSTVFVTAHDVLNEYIKIAFADMTDFVEFNDETVRLRDSRFVNGKLISEVKQGKDGISIKLHDKMRSLEKLDKLFDLIPDRRLQLERERLELQKQAIDGTNGNGTTSVIVDDISG